MKNERNIDELIKNRLEYKYALKGDMNNSFNGKEFSGAAGNINFPPNNQAEFTNDITDSGFLDELDLICFSHLRWFFVFQRPQHLLSRFAKKQRVFFIEEPHFDNPEKPYLEEVISPGGVKVISPHLPQNLPEAEIYSILKMLIDELLLKHRIRDFVSWYYTPMALPYTNHFKPIVTVYDCMDELSNFKGAHQDLLKLEDELFLVADIVFTGGMHLFEYKKDKHHNIYGFPSSIEREHFESGINKSDPSDQAHIPHPRVGFYGVIDERLNVELINGLANILPDWQIILIGPVVKIDPAHLPRQVNIHYLGPKDYKELPLYVANWDVTMLPFALNEATRFISPTKTPEYLAAGKKVVSTSINDVIRPYGDEGLVHIADTVEDFAGMIKRAYSEKDDLVWKKKTDQFLTSNSWDKTFIRMKRIIESTIKSKFLKSMKTDKELLTISESQEGWKSRLTKFLALDGWEKAWSQMRTSISTALNDDNLFSGIGHVNDRDVKFDYLIVGAGYAGSVLAHKLAKESDKKVLIIDKRDHIGGNAYDFYNEDGILIHKYGPHIFHTNSKEVFEFLSQFTKWRHYEHRVLASVEGSLLPIPINLDTINSLYGFQFNAFELEKYFESVAEHKEHLMTSEDVVVNKVGRDLYEKFFRGYTRKQWGLDPSELNASVTARVPTRTNRDGRYFTDVYQAMPLHGYTRMFNNMLNHPNIKIMLNTDYKDILQIIPFNEMIFTGPIDEFFNYKFGKLPYRSLHFEFETHDIPVYQKVGTINYPNEHKFTRITEFKYLSGQQHSKTTIVSEYPQASGDPYYPVPQKENNDLYLKYEKLAKEMKKDVHFVGRLATYKYYNMDQVVAQALSLYKKLKKNHEVESEVRNELKSK
jgi:UDP-galactopyranose mutase